MKRAADYLSKLSAGASACAVDAAGASACAVDASGAMTPEDTRWPYRLRWYPSRRILMFCPTGQLQFESSDLQGWTRSW